VEETRGKSKQCRSVARRLRKKRARKGGIQSGLSVINGVLRVLLGVNSLMAGRAAVQLRFP